jgi:hypothetical protein
MARVSTSKSRKSRLNLSRFTEKTTKLRENRTLLDMETDQPTDQPTDQLTNQSTDQWIDEVSYRGAMLAPKRNATEGRSKQNSWAEWG